MALDFTPIAAKKKELDFKPLDFTPISKTAPSGSAPKPLSFSPIGKTPAESEIVAPAAQRVPRFDRAASDMPAISPYEVDVPGTDTVRAPIPTVENDGTFELVALDPKKSKPLPAELEETIAAKPYDSTIEKDIENILDRQLGITGTNRQKVFDGVTRLLAFATLAQGTGAGLSGVGINAGLARLGVSGKAAALLGSAIKHGATLGTVSGIMDWGYDKEPDEIVSNAVKSGVAGAVIGPALEFVAVPAVSSFLKSIKSASNVSKAYRSLNVKKGASPDAVKSAYRKAMIKAHPDTGGSAEEFINVQQAYKTIKQSKSYTKTQSFLKGFKDYLKKKNIKPADVAKDPGQLKKQLMEFKPEMKSMIEPVKLTPEAQRPADTGLINEAKQAIAEGKAIVPTVDNTKQDIMGYMDEQGIEYKKSWSKQKMLSVANEVKVPVSERDLSDLTVDEARAELRPATAEKIEKTFTKLQKAVEGEKVGRLIAEESILRDIVKGNEIKAREAFNKGKKQGIFKAKEKYQDMVARAKDRRDMRIEINKIINDLQKVKKELPKMSPHQANPIRCILNDIDLTKMSSRKKINIESLKNFLESNPESEMPGYVLESLERLDKTALRDLTIVDIRNIYNSVMHHYTLEKNKQQIRVKRENRRAETVVSDSIAEMRKPKYIEQDISTSSNGSLVRVKRAGKLIKNIMGLRHDHYDLMIESLSGPNSTMHDVFYNNIKDGITKEMSIRHETYKLFEDTLNIESFKAKHDIKNVDAWYNERQKVGKFELTRGERMSLYRHSLNGDNRRSIVEGGIGFKSSDTPDRVHKMTEEELENIIADLSPAELEYAGDPVTNIISKLQSEITDTFYEANGYPMPLESNYYPKDVMSIGVSPGTLEEMQIEVMRRAKQLRVGTSKGFLNRRKRVAVPLYLNDIAYDMTNSIGRNSAYAGLEMPMRNASKLLYNNKFRAEISKRYGRDVWTEIEKGLQDIVNDWTSYSTVEQVLIKLKNKMSTAILGLNPFVMAKQALSFPLYNIYVDMRYMMGGLSDYILNPKVLEGRHNVYSPEYMERISSGFSRDVADVFKSKAKGKLLSGKTNIHEKAMGGIKLFDKSAVTPGMQGAVLQVLDEFNKRKMSKYVKQALDMTEEGIPEAAEERMKLAYKYADWVTERTQPMFRPEHRSSLSRGTPLEQLMTQFSAFTNQALNMSRRLYRDAKRDGDPKASGKMIHFMMLMLLNAAGVGTLDYIRDRYLKKREDAELGKKIGGAILDTPFSMFYFVRDLEHSAKSKMQRGTFMGSDVTIPVQRIPNLLSETIANALTSLDPKKSDKKKKKAADDFIVNMTELSLTLSGIPFHTPRQVIGAFKDTKTQGRSR